MQSPKKCQTGRDLGLNTNPKSLSTLIVAFINNVESRCLLREKSTWVVDCVNGTSRTSTGPSLRHRHLPRINFLRVLLRAPFRPEGRALAGSARDQRAIPSPRASHEADIGVGRSPDAVQVALAVGCSWSGQRWTRPRHSPVNCSGSWRMTRARGSG